MIRNLQGKTILITGAGGPAIHGMIKTLRETCCRIVTVDMNANSAGFFLSDASYVVPPGNNKNFYKVLKNICIKESVDSLISVVDEELPFVSKLESLGINVIQPKEKFVKLCLDKFECMNQLLSVGLSAPETWLLSDLPSEVTFPLFVKPRFGRGSRGCFKATSKLDLEEKVEHSNYKASELIVQKFISGTEYTVSVVCWRDGEIQQVVPKEIISKIGVTKLAVTRKNINIVKICKAIQSKFNADGPFNVQLIVDKNGIPYPFEINPRFSTSITLTNASGVNELVGLILQSLYGRNAFEFSDFKEGIYMIRQTTDFFVKESDLNK